MTILFTKMPILKRIISSYEISRSVMMKKEEDVSRSDRLPLQFPWELDAGLEE